MRGDVVWRFWRVEWGNGRMAVQGGMVWSGGLGVGSGF